MKPRIRYCIYQKVWLCTYEHKGLKVWEWGETPQHAYFKWLNTIRWEL